MDIMIAGAGMVGYSLARKLSYRHNVIVVDKNIQTLNRLEEEVDIMTLWGDVEDPKTYHKMQIDTIDLFIAVTDSDEANLLSTLMVEEEISVKKKIIRLRNEYFEHSLVLKKLDIEFAVFPDRLTAKRISKIFDIPKANNVKGFRLTPYELISVRVQHKDEEIVSVSQLCSSKVTVVGIEREKRFFLPSVDEKIEEGDLLYFFGERQVIETKALLLDAKMPTAIKKVAIFGANPLAQKIAKELSSRPLEIKMVDKNREYCKQASEYLQGEVTVINAAYDDHRLFEEEGLKNADMIIAAGMDDERNIVKCIEAREYGVPKTVAINNDKVYYPLMHQLGIVVVRGSKTGAYYAILENIASSAVVSERHFCGGRAVLFMRRIYPNSPLTGKPVTPPPMQDVHTFLLRDGKIISVSEAGVLCEDDVIVVTGETQEEEKIQAWIYTL
jgi:trk system potassium uptake protein TrkA